MLFEIAIALITAKIFNIIFEKIKQPGLLGEILAGIVLGPCCIGFFMVGQSINLFGITLFSLELDLAGSAFKELATIGVIFFLFIIGLNTNLGEFKRKSTEGFITSLFGVIFSFLFGFFLSVLFQWSILISIAVGILFMSSSVVLTTRILANLNILGTPIGLTIHTADIINYILVFFLLALVVSEVNPLVLGIKAFFFIICALLAGILLFYYTTKMKKGRKTPMMFLTLGLMICFFFAAFAENIGISALIGAFVAGLIMKRVPQGAVITEYLEMIGYAFFIPLYFVWIGASFDFSYLLQSEHFGFLIFFISIFVIFGLLGKFIGCSIGARLSGFTKREAISIGLGMMPRMGIVLVIVTSQIELGVFGDPAGLLAQQIKIATLVLVLVSSFITPPLLKRSIAPPYLKGITKVM